MSLPLGRVVVTRSIDHWMRENGQRVYYERRAFIESCLARHKQGDWGVVCREDATANNRAVANGARILSVYEHEILSAEYRKRTKRTVTRIWIITEHDRSVTTVLFPEDY